MGIIKAIDLLIRAFLVPRLSLAAKDLALRQQVAVYQHIVKCLKLRPRDRIFRVWLARLWSNWRSALAIVQAQAKPRYLICDKEKQFWCKGFKDWCERKGIRPRFGAVGQHGSIAVVERFIQTVKMEYTRRLLVSRHSTTFRRSCLGSPSGTTNIGRIRRWELDGLNPSLSLDGEVVQRPTPLREYLCSFTLRIGQYVKVAPQFAFHGCIRNIEIRAVETVPINQTGVHR